MLSHLIRMLSLLILLTAWASAAKVGSLTFTPPPGWTVKIEKKDAATLTPPAGAAQGYLVLFPDIWVSGDVKSWFATTVKQLNGDLTVISESKVNLDAASAHPFVFKSVELERSQGTEIRNYSALLSGNTATVYVALAPNDEAMKALTPSLVALINSQQPDKTAPLPAVKPQNAGQFKAAGGDPDEQLIPDEFRCYQETEGDSLISELTVQILPGGKYRTLYGAGSFVVKKGKYSLEPVWSGGPLDGVDTNTNLALDDAGQRFELSGFKLNANDDRLNFECYQRGPRETLALLEFKFKTPAPAKYACTLKDDSAKSGGTLEILPNRGYRFGGQTGQFSTDFRSKQRDSRSTLEFTGGPLDGEDASYQEDENGVRTVYFPSGSRGMDCLNVGKPNPAERYGSAKAPAPPKGSGGLSGAYVASYPDRRGNCDFTCWETYIFTKNGYVYTSEPDSSLAEADCSRTYPNGFPICEVYRVQGSSILIGDSKSPFKKVGKTLEIDGHTFGPILPLDGLKLKGTYTFVSVRKPVDPVTFSFGIPVDLSPASSRFSYTFTPQGQFTAGDRTGTYRFVGNTLELKYKGGEMVRRFVYAQTVSGKPDLRLLRIEGESYSLENKK
ncbi:hypothetical protein [Deinococcus sp.]|uniref:hypothetical protein n=1 Tax=Deinococcus sp. TaxID=47478 RepID=UPI003B5B7E39